MELRDRVATGVPGLDDVLGGGLPPNGIYLLQGRPGVGKTTLSLQFLLEGARRGEGGLYVALSETRREVSIVARSHGWSLDGVCVWELSAGERQEAWGSEQTMFHPAEVELEETTRPILEEIERLKPQRVVIDSLSEIRLLSREPLRYRRQLLALKHFFLARECTVLVIDTLGMLGTESSGILETMIGGLILLDKATPAYGTTRRRLVVDKLRGVAFHEGYHDFRIKTGGISVYPRLGATERRRDFHLEPVGSGIPELDTLLGGGLERGTSTLLIGAAGTGKSSLATQYALAAAARGEQAVIYTFEETFGTWLARTTSLGFEVQTLLEANLLRIVQVDPAEVSPGEFSSQVRDAVEQDGAQMVIVDSLNGYLQSVPEEKYLQLHLYELLRFLSQQGVTTVMNMAQHGLLGLEMTTPVDVSYLADTVLMLRYFEVAGEVRQALSVVKKRSGRHERTIREFRLDAGGIRLGEPLQEFQGILTGVPTYRGAQGPLIQER